MHEESGERNRTRLFHTFSESASSLPIFPRFSDNFGSSYSHFLSRLRSSLALGCFSTISWNSSNFPHFHSLRSLFSHWANVTRRGRGRKLSLSRLSALLSNQLPTEIDSQLERSTESSTLQARGLKSHEREKARERERAEQEKFVFDLCKFSLMKITSTARCEHDKNRNLNVYTFLSLREHGVWKRRARASSFFIASAIKKDLIFWKNFLSEREREREFSYDTHKLYKFSTRYLHIAHIGCNGRVVHMRGGLTTAAQLDRISPHSPPSSTLSSSGRVRLVYSMNWSIWTNFPRCRRRHSLALSSTTHLMTMPTVDPLKHTIQHIWCWARKNVIQSIRQCGLGSRGPAENRFFFCLFFLKHSHSPLSLSRYIYYEMIRTPHFTDEQQRRKKNADRTTTFVIGRAGWERERWKNIYLSSQKRPPYIFSGNMWCEEYEDLSWKSERRVYLIKWPIMPTSEWVRGAHHQFTLKIFSHSRLDAKKWAPSGTQLRSFSISALQLSHSTHLWWWMKLQEISIWWKILSKPHDDDKQQSLWLSNVVWRNVKNHAVCARRQPNNHRRHGDSSPSSERRTFMKFQIHKFTALDMWEKICVRLPIWKGKR